MSLHGGGAERALRACTSTNQDCRHQWGNTAGRENSSSIGQSKRTTVLLDRFQTGQIIERPGRKNHLPRSHESSTWHPKGQDTVKREMELLPIFRQHLCAPVQELCRLHHVEKFCLRRSRCTHCGGAHPLRQCGNRHSCRACGETFPGQHRAHSFLSKECQLFREEQANRTRQLIAQLKMPIEASANSVSTSSKTNRRTHIKTTLNHKSKDGGHRIIKDILNEPSSLLSSYKKH